MERKSAEVIARLKGTCPVTRGRETTMTQASFDLACRIAKEDAEQKQSAKQLFVIPACLDCKQMPQELTIIELDTLKINREAEMSTAKRFLGKCDVCGDSKHVRNMLGKNICSMCENLRSMVRQRPQVVMAAIMELAPEALPAGQTPINDTEVEKLRAQLVELTATTNEQAELLERRLGELEAANMELGKLREENSTWEKWFKAPGEEPTDDIPSGRRQAFTDLALRLAIGSMRGDINGVQADDIELLRSI